MEKETVVVSERDGRTNSWMKDDGAGFTSLKSNYFKMDDDDDDELILVRVNNRYEVSKATKPGILPQPRIPDCNIRGPFAKFVDSPYYSESEFCGGAVTVSFSKYLPWQAIHFLQRSTHFSRTCCIVCKVL
jgi:hypothetical protein